MGESLLEKESEIVARETRMGFRSWRPEWLQKFNSILSFTIVLSLSSLFQALIAGMTVVNLQTIETEFGFPSKYSGFITTGNDVPALLLVTVVSFFGDRASKPKWIGIGSIITGFGVILFALPKLLIGDYKPFGGQSTPLCMMQTNITAFGNDKTPLDACIEKESSSTFLYVTIFFIAQFFVGVGATPLQTLGPSYLDENVSPRMSPIFLGIWFTSAMMGPPLGILIGGIFLKTYTNLAKPKDIDIKDPRWVGAWWLGYVAFAGLFVLFGLFLSLFPKRMSGKQQKKREASIKSGHLPDSDDNIEYTLKGYCSATFRILANKVLMFSIFGLTLKLLFGIGIATFLIKILIVKFGVEPSKAGMILGAVMMPSLIIGVMGGAFVINRLKVHIAAKTAAKICLIVNIISMMNAFMFLIPGCSNTNLAGVMTPYHNSTIITKSIDSKCNSQCHCKQNIYIPICGSDGKAYHSPCHAGCSAASVFFDMEKKKFEPIFGNCSCIPPTPRSQKNTTSQMMKMMHIMSQNNNSQISLKELSYRERLDVLNDLPEDEKMKYSEKMKMHLMTFFNQATIGKCDRGCKNFYFFIFLVIIMLLLTFFGSTPHKIMVLRCVPSNQRSFALGAQYVIMRGFSFLPGPILLGAILDSECISWGYNKCGKKTNCHDYNIDGLSKRLVIFGVSVGVIGALLYFLAWWFYPTPTGNTLLDDNKNDDEDKIELF